MANLSRTKWCVLACALSLLASAHAAPVGKPLRMGVQLWSVRDDVKRDIDATLADLAKLGFQGVEFAGEFGRYANAPSALRTVLVKNGLGCAGAHVRLEGLKAETFEATTGFYKALGCTTLIIALDARAVTKDGAVEVARELTSTANKLKAAGMQLGYHNHEAEMLGADGQTPWDVIASGTPSNVILEQDVGWTTFAGKDPAAIVQRSPGRSASLHMKSKFAKGTTGTPIIGQDRTDWRTLITAARHVGATEWLVIELDDPPPGMSPMEGAAASLRGLQSVIAQMPEGR